MKTKEAAKHTPGPWEATSRPDGRMTGTVYGIRHSSEGCKGGEFAEVHALHVTQEAYDTAQASARLIAAAPDLLEILKSVEVMLDGCGYGGSNRTTENKHLRSIRAAIAKAEGK